MRQRLDERLVGVLQARVLADDGDRDLALGVVDVARDLLPGVHAGLGRRVDAEGGQHFRIEAFLVVGHGHVVDVPDVQRLDDRAFAHVAEEREFAALLLRDVAIGAHQKDVGRDADGAQFLHRMLRRLGLEFAGRRIQGISVRWT